MSRCVMFPLRSVMFVLLAVLSVVSLSPVTAFAAAKPTNAIRVSPALSNIHLSPGETSTTVAATVSNLTSAPLSVFIMTRDFGSSLTSASAISLYDNRYDPSTNPHGLQTAVSLVSPQVTLAPHETHKIPITLNHVDGLAAGGHYAAILFSPAPQTSAGKRTKVAINSSVASLIFLETASGGTQTLRLTSFSTSPLKFSLPNTTYIAFKDTGNTQSAPRGQLTLYGPGGSIVSTTVLNPGSGLVLPGASRLFTTLLPLPHTWLALPGIYRLELQYRDPSQSKFTVVNQRFLFINPLMALLLILLVVILVLVLKRLGRGLHRLIRRSASTLKQLFGRKPKPEEPPKPKKKPPLIQG